MIAASVAPGAADRHGPAPRTGYRPDIDGLRAVAVVAVVLFHAEVPGFDGGYVGVDVFFVISGYLITNLLLAEPSLVRFYERRIRRIFPALFATMAFCLAAACLLLLPQDLERFGHSLLATTWFVSNLLFWSEAGYFDAAAELKPLLHTWSLAVEEQFYIVFPLYLLALARLQPKLRAPLTFALCVLSLLVSEWLVRVAAGAFFLTPARGFELLIGACLAMGGLAPPRGRLAAEAMAVGGGLLIAGSILFYAPETVFPGLHALVPCLGAALVIYAGTSGGPQLNRALAAGPVVFIGLISYSLYLWHWPILTFARYWLIRPLQPAETALLIALSLLVAALSWRFVEMPFRGRAPLLTRRSLFGAAGAVMGAAGALAGLIIAGDGFPARWPPDLVALAAAASDRPPARCNDRAAAQVERRELCRLGLPGDVAPSFIVWGDSHGEALVPPIDRAAAVARRSGWLVTKAGCPALLGVGQQRPGFNRSCIDFGRAVEDLLAATPSIATVLLISRWAIYATGERYGAESGARVLIGTPDSHRYALAENPRVFEAGLMRTLERLRELGMQAVIVAQVPEVGWDVPGVLARGRRFGTELAIEPTLADYLARQRLVHRVFERARERYGVQILYPHEVFCSEIACTVLRDGRPLYADADHLSRFGSDLLTDMFRPALTPARRRHDARRGAMSGAGRSAAGPSRRAAGTMQAWITSAATRARSSAM